MAAGNFTLYNSGVLDLLDGTQDWSTDDHYVVLLDSGYTPSGAHTTYSNISSDEVSDADYDAQDMTGESVTEPSGGTVRADADNVSFGDPVTITAKYAVVLVGTAAGKDAGDALVGYVDLDDGGTTVSSTNGAFTIQWNSNGLFQVTQS